MKTVPVFGQLPVDAFIHQGKLRPPVQAKDFQVVSSPSVSAILAMIEFWQLRPPVVVISAIGLEGQE